MNDAFRQMFAIGPQAIDGSMLETVREVAVERLLGDALSSGESGAPRSCSSVRRMPNVILK